jgi:antitoxin CcdA
VRIGGSRASRQPAKLTIDAALAAEARAPGLNLSLVAEAGLRAAVAAARADRWRAENAAALESSNAWVEANGLPLAAHRPF